MTTPSSQDIANKISTLGWTKHFDKPRKASGQCYLATEKILNYYSHLDPELEVAFARHHNDPEGRYYQHGQYSNHYAIWLPEEQRVVDFTLRQFAPTSAYPWVGTYSAWLRILARAWDVPSVKHLTRSRGHLCTACASVNCDPYGCPEEIEDY